MPEHPYIPALHQWHPHIKVQHQATQKDLQNSLTQIQHKALKHHPCTLPLILEHLTDLCHVDPQKHHLKVADHRQAGQVSLTKLRHLVQNQVEILDRYHCIQRLITRHLKATDHSQAGQANLTNLVQNQVKSLRHLQCQEIHQVKMRTVRATSMRSIHLG